MSATNNGNNVPKSRNSKKVIPDGYELVPPDGNYAWVVAFACFVAGLVSTTAIPIFSVLFSDILILYETNTATASWIPSITLATGSFLGPVSTVLINTFGVRKSTIIGSLILSTGMITSFFVERIEILCITYGIINGYGSYLCFICYPIVLSQYFKKFYGIAVGLVTASYAAGRLVITLLAQYLLSEYGCRGVFLILGANMLHVVVAASLFQPIKRHLILVPINTDKKKLLKVETSKDGQSRAEVSLIKDENDSDNNCTNEAPNNVMEAASYSTKFGSVSSICVADVKISTNVTNAVRSHNCSCFSWCCKEICGKIDFTVLREPCFYIVCSSGFLQLNLMVLTNFFLYPLGVEKGYSGIQLASVVSSKAIVDISSRVLGPAVATYFGISVRHFYISLGFVHGIILLMVVFVESFGTLMIWAMASGMVFGAKTSFHTVLIVKTMGTERLSSVFGLSSFIQGFFMLIMAPLLGWVHDSTGSFVNIFIVLAIQQFILITLWIIKPYLQSK